MVPPHRLPRALMVHTDNTAREGVNQTYATYLSTLVATGKFEQVSSKRLQKDHTHNELDQRFSSVGTTLSRAPSLEDEDEFCDWLRTHVQPASGRKLVVERLDSTYDFQTWHNSLDLHLTGLTPTPAQPKVHHVWEFVQRAIAERIVGSGSLLIENHHKVFDGMVMSSCW